MPNSINPEAWTRLRAICHELEYDNQKLVNKLIEEAIKQKMKYTKAVVTRDKLVYLINNRIGTTRIENLAKQIDSNSPRNPNTVVYIVENSLNRVNKEIKLMKHYIFLKDKVIKSHLKTQWRRQAYLDLCHSVITPLWIKEKQYSSKSKDYLYKKYKNSRSYIVKEGPIQVVIKPSLTVQQRNQFISDLPDPVCMGITLDENEKAFLKLPQSLTDHSSFDKHKMYTDVALMGSKVRMTVKSRLDQGLTEEQVNQRTCEEKRVDAIDSALITRVYDPSNKVADFSKMRVTSMKTCRRVKIPDPLPEKEEAAVQSVITAIESAINEEQQRVSKLKIKPSTLSKSESLGLKSLRKRTKQGEAAIVATDKSGRLSVMSKEVYNSKVKEHTGSDPIVSQDKVNELEVVLSATASSLARIMCIGDKWNQSDRVQSAVKATNTNVPPMAILLKDHKPGDDKPVRPLCRSTESPNGPLSHMTAKVMNIVATELNSENRTEVKSTEEMIAVLDSVNDITPEDFTCINKCGVIQQSQLANHMITTHPDHIPNITVGSMDVKALYPSLDIDHSCEIIKQLLSQSQVKFEVDDTNMALHIAATHTQIQIDDLGISDIIHTRRYKYGQRPTIISKSVTGTQTEREVSDSWVQPKRLPTSEESKHMFAIVISESVKLVMRSHVYTSSNVIRLQMLGMAIGSTATAEVAKLVMLEHDRILWLKCQEAGLTRIKSGRYVDDENPVFKPVPHGARLVDGKVTISHQHIKPDKLIPHDRRTFNIIQQIANNIWPNIQFTVDVPSECPSGMIPMLDMEVGVNQTGHIFRKFYVKPMNTPFTILSRSAHSWQIKRSTLTQEGVRRLLNTSPNAPSQVFNQIMTDWDQKMNVSGYDINFRANVIKSAVQIYTHKVTQSNNGGRPLYRPAGWEATERDLEKLVKRQTWYSGKGNERNLAPLIIDPTPSGNLENNINQILKESARLTGIRIKMCQRGGTKVSSAAKSDPFADILCDRDNCTVCSSPDSKGGCRHSNVGYELVCNACSDQGITSTYQGETSKSSYERGKQHLEGLTKKVEDNPIWKHSQIVHNGDNKVSFSMHVKGRFRKPMERQENEAIRIRESMAVHQMNSKREFHQPAIIRLIPVSNNLQSDQTGTMAPIMPAHKRKAPTSYRPDSPTVQSRSKRVNQGSYYVANHQNKNRSSTNTTHHTSTKHYNPNHHTISPVVTTRSDRQDQNTTSKHTNTHQYSISPVVTTRSERQDQNNTHSRTRSHHINSPLSKREEERRHYKSPSVHRAYKPQQHHRDRSMSPVWNKLTKHSHKNSTNHINNKHSDRRTPPPQSLSSNPISSKNKKSQKNTNNGHTSNPIPSSNTMQPHQPLNLDCSPVSPESLSFCLRKLNGTTQGNIPLSLSPVSQVNMTQYSTNKTPVNIHSSHSTKSTSPQDDMFSQVSPEPNTNSQHLVHSSHTSNSLRQTSPIQRDPTYTTITYINTPSPKKPREYKPPSPPSPPSHMNTIKVSAQVHTPRTAPNTKTHNITSDSNDDMQLHNVASMDLIPDSERESISDEFDTSWGEELITSSVSSVTSNQHTQLVSSNTSPTPIITVEAVKYAIEHPITTMSQYNALKQKRLQKVQKIKKNNLKSDFSVQIDHFEKTFKSNPVIAKKRTPRKNINKNISYFEE